MTKEAALQLGKHFGKTEYQLKHPRISDTVLTSNAKWVLSELERERETAKDEQGYPERVQDWWAAPTKSVKRMRNRKNMKQLVAHSSPHETQRIIDVEQDLDGDLQGSRLDEGVVADIEDVSDYEYYGYSPSVDHDDSPENLDPAGDLFDFDDALDLEDDTNSIAELLEEES